MSWEVSGGIARIAHAVAVIARVGALVWVAAALPFVWHRYPNPAGALALFCGLALETAVVLALWRRAGSVTRAGLLIDVPAGVAALLTCAWLTPNPPQGWSNFAHPYTILVAITLGLACRRPVPAVLLGMTWGAAFSAAVTLFHHADLLFSLTAWPSYVANTLIGWAVGRLQVRADVSLEQARSQELAATTTLAAERVRLQQAGALHDRVLQTLETLAAGNLIANDEHRTQVRAHALWLRTFVRDGTSDSGSVTAALETAAETARRAGLTVDIHDATPATTAPSLAEAQRNALVNATAHLLGALAQQNESAVVHVEPEPDCLLVTILVTAGGTAPPDHDLAVARTLLTTAGGALHVEPLPYLELRVPVG